MRVWVAVGAHTFGHRIVCLDQQISVVVPRECLNAVSLLNVRLGTEVVLWERRAVHVATTASVRRTVVVSALCGASGGWPREGLVPARRRNRSTRTHSEVVFAA